jgi:hypothetical protein
VARCVLKIRRYGLLEVSQRADGMAINIENLEDGCLLDLPVFRQYPEER